MILDLIRDYTHTITNGSYGKKITLTEFHDVFQNRYLWVHEENSKTFQKIMDHEEDFGPTVKLEFNIRNIIKEDKAGKPFIYRIERPRIKEEK